MIGLIEGLQPNITVVIRQIPGKQVCRRINSPGLSILPNSFHCGESYQSHLKICNAQKINFTVKYYFELKLPLRPQISNRLKHRSTILGSHGLTRLNLVTLIRPESTEFYKQNAAQQGLQAGYKCPKYSEILRCPVRWLHGNCCISSSYKKVQSNVDHPKGLDSARKR